jgi:UDP-glucose 4-epimerase
MTSAYADRRVLVAGGLGFIGRHLTARLRDAGAQVTVATRSLDDYHEPAAALASQGVKVVEADLRDRDAMCRAVRRQDVVFNVAGRSGATLSMEDPWTDLDVNCRGTLVLLEALRTDNPRAKLVFVSSRLTYGHGGAEPASEERTPDPLCVHAVHKLAAEHYLRLYGRVYGVAAAIARLTNPYGPGQPAGRTAYGVVNRLIHLAVAGDTLTVYGDGHQRRDYLYIDDAVEALLRIGEDEASNGRTYNVGSGIGTPLIDMARAIVAIAGGGRIEHAPWPLLAGQIETGDFVASIERIRRELGWEPRTALAEGLQRTVADYRSQFTTFNSQLSS